MTRISSAYRTVLRRWATITLVRPLNSTSMARSMRRSLSVSTLEVASSRMSTRGSASRARAKLMSCRCPVLSPEPPSCTSVA